MMSGMSREKPAEVFVRWIERIWSAYDVRGERIRLEWGKFFFFWIVSQPAHRSASQISVREREKGGRG